MAPDALGSSPDVDLVGSEAWHWLRERGPLGPHLLDFSVSTLPLTFGRERRAGAYVPRDPWRGRRWDFFLAIEGRADRTKDWEELVQFEERLLEYLDTFNAPEPVLRLGQRFHPVLVSEPPDAVRLDAAADAWIPRS